MKIEELKKFCSKDKTRLGLLEPFSIGNFTYATNGHIAVRVPLLIDVKIADPKKHPMTIEKMFEWDERLLFSSFHVEIPKLELVKEKCFSCNHDCPSCDCHESCECENGFYTYEKGPTILINSVPFDACYIRQIQSLLNVMVQEDNKQNEGLKFKFDGGHGLLMPLMKGTKTFKRFK